MHHVGVVAKRVRAAAAETAAANKWDDNTSTGPTSRGVKKRSTVPQNAMTNNKIIGGISGSDDNNPETSGQMAAELISSIATMTFFQD